MMMTGGSKTKPIPLGHVKPTAFMVARSSSCRFVVFVLLFLAINPRAESINRSSVYPRTSL